MTNIVGTKVVLRIDDREITLDPAYLCVNDQRVLLLYDQEATKVLTFCGRTERDESEDDGIDNYEDCND